MERLYHLPNAICWYLVSSNFSADGWPVDVEENESEFDLDQSVDLIIGDYASLSIAKLRFWGASKKIDWGEIRTFAHR